VTTGRSTRCSRSQRDNVQNIGEKKKVSRSRHKPTWPERGAQKFIGWGIGRKPFDTARGKVKRSKIGKLNGERVLTGCTNDEVEGGGKNQGWPVTVNQVQKGAVTRDSFSSRHLRKKERGRWEKKKRIGLTSAKKIVIC